MPTPCALPIGVALELRDALVNAICAALATDFEVALLENVFKTLVSKFTPKPKILEQFNGSDERVDHCDRTFENLSLEAIKQERLVREAAHTLQSKARSLERQRGYADSGHGCQKPGDGGALQSGEIICDDGRANRNLGPKDTLLPTDQRAQFPQDVDV